MTAPAWLLGHPCFAPNRRESRVATPGPASRVRLVASRRATTCLTPRRTSPLGAPPGAVLSPRRRRRSPSRRQAPQVVRLSQRGSPPRDAPGRHRGLARLRSGPARPPSRSHRRVLRPEDREGLPPDDVLGPRHWQVLAPRVLWVVGSSARRGGAAPRACASRVLAEATARPAHGGARPDSPAAGAQRSCFPAFRARTWPPVVVPSGVAEPVPSHHVARPSPRL